MFGAMSKWAVGAAALLLIGVCATCQSRPPRGDEDTVRGIVREFTTAPRGEVDGLILDDDTVLHWPPHLESRYADVAKKGDRVEAIGRWETNPEGVKQLEISSLSRLNGRDASAGSVEQRLRVLEKKVDQLASEIKRLQHDQD